MTISTITSVTLFTDRARITRATKATVQPGVQKVTIGDLPLAMDPASVRARGAGTARAKLLGVTTRIENFVETPAHYARELERLIQSST